MKQQKFVDCYEGNATEAAEIAGYAHAGTAGARMLQNVAIQNALANKPTIVKGLHIMSVEERAARLTDIANGEDEKTVIKAVDVLNKMDSIYIQKHEVKANYQGMTDDEVQDAIIKKLESKGFTVIPPEG